MKKYTFNDPWDIVRVALIFVALAAMIIGWVIFTMVALLGMACIMIPWLIGVRLNEAFKTWRYCREQR